MSDVWILWINEVITPCVHTAAAAAAVAAEKRIVHA